MTSPHPSFDIPKRVSLSSQAAITLRKAIADGVWKESLPSERRLCEMLQVSRPTIRTALHLLGKEGLLGIRQGRRHRLLSRSTQAARDSRLVVLVTSQPLANLALVTFEGISEMRAHLAEQDFATEILVCPAGNARAQKRKIEEFLRQNSVFCCVLVSLGEELQQWFSSHPVSALVLGSCHPKIKLPSLDIDQRAVCRHAAGVFLSQGHRRIALVVPDSKVAGDLASEQGFRDAVEQLKGNSAAAVVVRHNGTARHISAKLDALFDSPQAPTGLLVAKPQHVFIVVIYLLKRGFSVPDTLSLIARDHDPLFEIVSPPISHYRLEKDTYSHRLSRLMLQMVHQGYVAPEPSLIFPKYAAGGTVKRLE
ncbi:MAG: hypothetical protein RIQ93_2733 [Verrucomicrobiota bacterium]|jgi:LacI family transcriptional regulator